MASGLCPFVWPCMCERCELVLRIVRQLSAAGLALVRAAEKLGRIGLYRLHSKKYKMYKNVIGYGFLLVLLRYTNFFVRAFGWMLDLQKVILLLGNFADLQKASFCLIR